MGTAVFKLSNREVDSLIAFIRFAIQLIRIVDKNLTTKTMTKQNKNERKNKE